MEKLACRIFELWFPGTLGGSGRETVGFMPRKENLPSPNWGRVGDGVNIFLNILFKIQN